VGLLAAFIPARGSKDSEGKQNMLVPGLLMTAGVVFFLLVSPISESFMNRAYTLAHLGKEDAWINREQVWHGAIKMISDHPVSGLGQSMYAFSHYPYTRLGMPIGLLHVRPSLADQTHNLYLQTAAETGIPGTAALVAMLITFWIAGIRRLKRMERSDRRNMLLGSLGATFAFAVDAIASPSWQYSQVMVFFWLVLGVGIACIRQTGGIDIRRNANSASIVSVPAWFRRPATAIGLLALAALMPVTVIASTRLNRFYPSTVYASVRGTVHHVEIVVLPDPCTPAEVAAYTPLYTRLAPFVQARMPAGVPRLPAPTLDQNQSVKTGPHYRLQLEVFLRDDAGIHDGGPITLDPNTHWSASDSDHDSSGTFRAEPYYSPSAGPGKTWSYGSYADFMAYINAPADAGRKIKVVAEYAGFKAATKLDFSPAANTTEHISSQPGIVRVSGIDSAKIAHSN
jgi:hypothetical protein